MAQEKRSLEIKTYDGPLKDKLVAVLGDFGPKVQISSENYITTTNYNKYWQEKLQNFKTRPQDVWVVSYPKSGTTWTQEMVWRILNDEGVIQKTTDNLMIRFPFFEWESFCPEDYGDPVEGGSSWKRGETWRILHSMKDPRTIKSHFHLDLLPDDILSSGAKIIYVCRDPRDVCVSYYYHSVSLAGFVGDFQDFFELFINDLHISSPYWKHVLDFWEKRDSSNVFFLRYEELQEDLPRVIYDVAEYLGTTLASDYVEELVEHLSFTQMSLNESVNNEDIPSLKPESKLKFMRKGKVGDWKSHFTAENKEAYKEWTEVKLKGSNFPYYRDYE